MGLSIRNSDFGSAVINAIGSGICKALDGVVEFGDALYHATQSAGIYDALRPYTPPVAARALLCGPPAPPLPPNRNLPSSGQCDGVGYTVRGYLIDQTGPPNGTRNLYFTQQVWGPITDFVPITTSSGTTSYNIVCRGYYGNAILPPGQLIPCGSGDSAGTIKGFAITSLTPIGSVDDSCGSFTPGNNPLPPEGLPVPVGPVIVGPPTDSNSFSFNATLVLFQPQVNNNFELIVPCTLNTDFYIGGNVNFSVNANVNLNTGDVNISFLPPGTSSPGGGSGGGQLTPVSPAPPPPSGVPNPGRGPGVKTVNRIVGVQVHVDSLNPRIKATQIAQGENPTIFAPNIGYVSFYFEDSQGNSLGWSSDIPVKNKYSYIPCPDVHGAVNVKGTPATGVTWTLTPVFGAVSSPL